MDQPITVEYCEREIAANRRSLRVAEIVGDGTYPDGYRRRLREHIAAMTLLREFLLKERESK